MQIYFRKVVCLLEKEAEAVRFQQPHKDPLSFNIYDVCYAKGAREQKEYIDYIDEQYNSERLTGILCDVTGYNQGRRCASTFRSEDYDPPGASVTLLISEKATDSMEIDKSCNREGMVDGKPLHPQRNGAAARLCHAKRWWRILTSRTLRCTPTPNITPTDSISTFRVDTDVSDLRRGLAA